MIDGGILPIQRTAQRVIVVQPALPSYRIDFFRRLSESFGKKFIVYSSPSDLGVLADTAIYSWSKTLGALKSYFGMEWQPGAVTISLEKGDLLVVCGAPRCISTLLLLVRARLLGIKTVWWGHYWSSTSKSYRLALRIHLMKLADAVVFYMDSEVADYRVGYGANDVRLVTALNNGIDVSFAQKLRESYRAESRQEKLLFLGRLTEKAELDTLLKALTEASLHNVRLEVIGDGPMRRQLMELASALELANRIIWHGETVDERVIAKVANECKLFVYPGAVGLSLIHAMTYGLPAVLHGDRWLHMPEFAAFDAHMTGDTFVKGDAVSLGAVVGKLLKNSSELNMYSLEASRRADCSYNTASMALRFERLVTLMRDVNV